MNEYRKSELDVMYSDLRKFSRLDGLAITVIRNGEKSYLVELTYPNDELGYLIVKNTKKLKLYRNMLTVEQDLLNAGFNEFYYKNNYTK